ncbi:MAG: nitronate monooxygenase [Acidobacteriota bacterium]|nr:nitronate monooxygenase [Acidobacteriota bacterium]
MDLLGRLGVRYPIFLSPMGAGPGTPELAAAVSRAGGLGALGAAYMTPPQIRTAAASAGSPLHINLFAGGWDSNATGDATRILSILSRVHERLGIDPPTLPKVGPDPFPEQLGVVLEIRPAMFSFTFGIPTEDQLRELRKANIVIAGTATSAREARLLADAGVDAIVLQGSEAGAHRGTFAERFEDAMVPLLQLTQAARRETSLPLIASGGLMTGGEIAEALRRGAVAAQLGTAFLACPESGASAAYKSALLDGSAARSVITRAFSGRPARGLSNAFHEMVEQSAILPYPLQNALTRPMRSAAAQRGESGFLSLWAGTGVARIRPLPAAELVSTLAVEMQQHR